MGKGFWLFVLGMLVGVGGFMVTQSPINPLSDWAEAQECQRYYAERMYMTEDEFVELLREIRDERRAEFGDEYYEDED